jgi:beta-lactamase regulating signal transducer with metallopeptidase domain
MISGSIADACSILLAHLVAPALRSLSLAFFAALALGAFRVKSVAARLAVWTAVLYVALAMPLLGVVLPAVSLQIPPVAARFLSQHLAPAIAPIATEKPAEIRTMAPAPAVFSAGASRKPPNSQSFAKRQRARVSVSVGPAVADSESVADSSSAPYSSSVNTSLPYVAATNTAFPWAAILAAFYFAVTALFLARLSLGIIFSRRLVRTARPIYDYDATRTLAIHAREARLAVAPRLAESESISVPVTLRILHPVILFPADWREWDSAALKAVIAHELSHVIRRDALTQRLSLLHRAIFWFSPLSWWLHRCLADAAEEASDIAALASGADRTRYAETLLGFFAALQETPRRVYWHGVSMAKAGQAEKRLDRILAWKGDVGMPMNRFIAIAMIFAGVPAVLFAAAARPSVANTPAADTLVTGASVAKTSIAITNDAAITNADQTVSPAPAPISVPAPAPEPAPAKAVPPRAPASPVSPASIAPPVPAAPEVAAPIVVPELPSVAAKPLPPVAPKPTPAPSKLAAPKPMSAAAPKVPPVPPQDQVTLDGSMNMERLKQLQQEIKQQVMSNKDELKDEMSAEIVKIIETQLKDIHVTPKIQIDLSALPQKEEIAKVKVRTDGFSDRFVIVSGDSPIFMSGDSQDVEHATALRGKVTGDFIWFQRDEKSYIIRDQATVNRAKELFKPQQDLGEKQQALGKQQQALGDQQRDIGKKMQTVQVQLPDMTADMQKLEAEMKQFTAGGTQQQLGDLQRQIGELQRKVGQIQSQAGDQMRQASEPMRALGQQQRELGEQQRALGEQQREASRQARDQMKQLLDDAVTKGTAQPE